VVKTTQSDILIAAAARSQLSGNAKVLGEKVDSDEAWISKEFTLEVEPGQEIILEKMLTMYTSRGPDSEDPLESARSDLELMDAYEAEQSLSAGRWKELWEEMDVVISGDREAQRLVRLHLYHSLVSASPHHAGLDSGIPPRGLHGEAYRGHIFWDELYILPLYHMHLPEVVRSVLMYRYRRLDAARAYAKEHGYEGAMFPWQSGSDGREETQIIHLNPLSGEWGDDYSSLQRHVSLAIAYNLCSYYHVTGDMDFMEQYGAEILLDICKFWASKARLEADGKYHVHRVMGPDEFHEALPGSEEGGLSDNAYTNIMLSWMMGRALALWQKLKDETRAKLQEVLSLREEDLSQWKDIHNKLALHLSEEGIIEQFAGYFDLEELDWEAYREKYEDIHRLDRILKAEGKSPDAYKLAKQADLLMVFYNLGVQEVNRILDDMGIEVPETYMRDNFNYYIQRTSHGSTLSRLVHARLAWKLGMKELGWDLYRDALRSDLVDIQGGTTGEGIHAGVMAGTVYDVLATYAGLDLSGEIPALDPCLPPLWKGLEFCFVFRGTRFQVHIAGDEIKISGQKNGSGKIKVYLLGKERAFISGESIAEVLKP